ncbi:MAG: NAD(P)-dependent alcohol dehydrogenase [Clostridiales bacterium]
MKALVIDKYMPHTNIALSEIDKPEPRDDELLVRIHASSINYMNSAHVRGKPFVVRLFFGLIKPKKNIPGSDIAGKVISSGKNVTRFKPGDEVYGDISICDSGAYAEYAAVPEKLLALKPANLTFEEAAVVPQSAALVALQALRNKGNIKAEQEVLICGASGGNGSFAVQIAKAYGATVTAVCSTRNIEMMRKLAVDHVIDYTKDDFVKIGKKYGLIIATAGYRSIFDYKKVLKTKGIYVSTGGAMKQSFQAICLGSLLSKRSGKKLCNLLGRENQEDLLYMKDLIETGKVKPYIDKTYHITDIQDAFTYYDKGKTRGKVAITIA